LRLARRRFLLMIRMNGDEAEAERIREELKRLTDSI
jgi:hypothetical protein